MNKDVVLGLVRHALTTIGGAIIVSKGLGDSETVNLIVGGIVAVIGIVWSIVDKKKA